MANREIADVLFERVYPAEDADGVIKNVTLQIGKPYLWKTSKGRDLWRCPIRIMGIGRGNVNNIPGFDPLEALLNALRAAERMLIHDATAENVKITWQGEADLGLVVPSLTKDHDVDPAISKRFEDLFEDFFRNSDANKGKTS